MTLENVGVGPARIHSFSMSHDGRAVTDLFEFIDQCCAGGATPVRAITSFVEGRILPAGQRIDFFTLPVDPAHPEVLGGSNACATRWTSGSATARFWRSAGR
jgi:hypothetical protein